MTSALSITRSANPPRAVFLDYPLGHTAGPPGEPDTQLDIMRTALGGFEEITESGDFRVLDQQWPEGEWKPKARELSDKRSERHDTPQYERPEDEQAAIAAHGADVACEVCAPEAVPTG